MNCSGPGGPCKPRQRVIDRFLPYLRDGLRFEMPPGAQPLVDFQLVFTDEPAVTRIV
jgi:hypothetical protein